MSAILMVFGVIFILSSVTLLSRQNIKRFSRQRRTMAVLAKVRQVADN